MTNIIPLDELVKINKSEMEKANALLGVKESRILGFKDSMIENNHELRMAINNTIRELRPAIGITHWNQNTHRDFTQTSLAVNDACMWSLLVSGPWSEKYPAHMMDRLYAFESPMLTVHFEPDTYVDISKAIEAKIKAIRCFDIHIKANNAGNAETKVSSVTGPNRRYGIESGVMYAEAFSQMKAHEVHTRARDFLG